MAYLDKRTGLFIAQVKVAGKLHRKPGWHTKAEADAWETEVKKMGSPPADGARLLGPSYAQVAKECIAAGGPKGAWGNGRDRTGLDRVHMAIDFFRDTPIAAIDTNMLLAYRKNVQARPAYGHPRTNSTVNRYMSAARSVLTYASERTPPYIPSVPKIPRLKPRERPRDEVPEDADLQIMTWLDKHGKRKEALVIEFLLASGLRRGELYLISPEQIGDDYVFLRRDQTKNDRDRRVFIDPTLARDMRALMASGSMPPPRTVLEALKEAARACVPGANIVIHSLRHSYANRLNRRNIPTRTIQSLLGHKDIATTQRYITPTDEDHRAASDTLRHARMPWPENSNIEAMPAPKKSTA